MELNERSPILEFNPEAIEAIRKQYNLDSSQRMDEAITILEDWATKQDHFTVKSFPRNFLERTLINNKGSIEAAKKKLDKYCTFKTLLPNFFEKLNVQEYDAYKIMSNALLPKLTPDYCRVMIVKCYGDSFEDKQCQDYFKYLFHICEYMQAYDYTNGLRYIVDCTEMDILAFVTNVNLLDFKKVMDINIGGYSIRIKGIHLISNSKSIEYVVMFLRKVFSAKIGQRIYCHSTIEALYDALPRDILPVEYGGDAKSTVELRDDLLNEIRSKDFVNYCEEMRKARTNEKLRPQCIYNEEYMGLPGTFRTLEVD